MMQFMKTCRLASLRACLFFCFVALTFAPTRADEPKFESLFNGKDLTGWKPEPGLWRVVDGCIEGGKSDGGPVERSTFMTVHRDGKDVIFKDFHFTAEFWIETSNSGIQYRSTRLHPSGFGVGGYQYEVSPGISTGFMHQQNHTGPRVNVGDSMVNDPSAKAGPLVGFVADQRWLVQQKFCKPAAWNRIDIICRGNHLMHLANGYPTIEYIDRDEKSADRKRRNDEGVLALQVHSADAFRVRYRNLAIKQFDDTFGDALRVYNDKDLDGWKMPGDGADCWTAKASEYDDRGRLKAFGYLACNGKGNQPLTLTTRPGASFIFRCQVKGDAWKPRDDSLFRAVAGWSLLEVTVRNGKASVELNGEVRTDLSAPIRDGQLALPSDVNAEYRNLICIPVE